MNPAPMTLRFELLDWWHAGTGQGRGGEVDAAAAREPDTGLPFIPGRTVRGLVREAVTSLEELDGGVPDGLPDWLFGGDVPLAARDKKSNCDDPAALITSLRRGRFETQAGAAIFGNATLPGAWRNWARRAPEARGTVAALFDTVAATAIEDKGLEADKTLRRIEVAAPMTLHAPLNWRPDADGVPGEADVAAVLEQALPLLRGLGKGRHRGLGRCRVSLAEVGEVAA